MPIAFGDERRDEQRDQSSAIAVAVDVPRPRAAGTTSTTAVERPEHDGDECQRQHRDGSSALPCGLHHADDEREQTPGGHVADGGTRERQAPELASASSRVGQDARQHWKRGDRHGDAQEQREVVKGTPLARDRRVEKHRQHRPQHERQRRCSSARIVTVARSWPRRTRCRARRQSGTCRARRRAATRSRGRCTAGGSRTRYASGEMRRAARAPAGCRRRLRQ